MTAPAYFGAPLVYTREGATYCTSCGLPTDPTDYATPPPEGIVCTHCGEWIAPPYCPECGESPTGCACIPQEKGAQAA